MNKKLVFILIFVLVFLKTIEADDQGEIKVNIIDTNSCNLNFKQGWNLFSFCSKLQETEIQNVLQTISGKYRYIMQWNPINQEFDIYSSQSNQNPFSKFNDEKSYFIYMLEDISLNIPGQEAETETRQEERRKEEG